MLPDTVIAALNEEKLRGKKAPDGALVALGLEGAGAGALGAKLMRVVPLLGGQCNGGV